MDASIKRCKNSLGINKSQSMRKPIGMAEVSRRNVGVSETHLYTVTTTTVKWF